MGVASAVNELLLYQRAEQVYIAPKPKLTRFYYYFSSKSLLDWHL